MYIGDDFVGTGGGQPLGFARQYMNETNIILDRLSDFHMEDLVDALVYLRRRQGRLFIIGVGGSAGTASHAVNDFRKICDIQAFCPTDNISELTARINDEGWSTCFSGWLKGCKIGPTDAILILSVGGGDEMKAVSVPLCNAISTAKMNGAAVFGIVGREGGYTAKRADVAVIIPPLYPDRITPHTEGIASVILHMIVSHPRLKKNQTKWEETDKLFNDTGTLGYHPIESGRTDRT